MDRSIPTRSNLNSLVIVLPSTMCPVCLEVPESTTQCLVSCPMARAIWFQVLSWWRFAYTDLLDIWSLLSPEISKIGPSLVDKVFHGVHYIVSCSLWKREN